MDQKPILRPGTALPPLTRRVTQDLIDAYADVSGDHNPIHVDPTFAAGTRFGRTIAHGMLTMAFVAQAVSRWYWDAFSRGGSLELSFLAPVTPGDEVVMDGEIVDMAEDGSSAVLEVRATVAGRTVAAGKATLNVKEETG